MPLSLGQAAIIFLPQLGVADITQVLQVRHPSDARGSHSPLLAFLPPLLAAMCR